LDVLRRVKNYLSG